MSCNLSIVGKDLDIDAVVKKTRLRPLKKSYKGQPRFKTKPDEEKLPYSWIGFKASNAGFDDFNQQVKDVTRYLKRNKDKLALISSFKEVEYFYLDFSVDYAHRWAQEMYMPTELVRLAGELGIAIQISVYTASDEEGE